MGLDPFIGEISIFAGNFEPVGWFFCDGRSLQISQFQALYAIIGTTYGGDGRVTFALPDLRGRSAIGVGQGPGLSPRAKGDKGGQEKVGLGMSEMPQHNHGIQATLSGAVTARLNALQDAGSSPLPSGAYIANNANAFKKSGAVCQMNQGSIAVDSSALQVAATVGPAGGGGSHANMPPFLAISYIINYNGSFPTRD